MKRLFTLFDAASKDLSSGLIGISPGWAVEITAFGMPEERFPDERLGLVHGRACVHKVIMAEGKEGRPAAGCADVWTVPAKREEILAEGPLMADGCPVYVWAGSNAAWLTLPGMYRLVLSRDEMLGEVQIYAQGHLTGELGLTKGA